MTVMLLEMKYVMTDKLCQMDGNALMTVQETGQDGIVLIKSPTCLPYVMRFVTMGYQSEMKFVTTERRMKTDVTRIAQDLVKVGIVQEVPTKQPQYVQKFAMTECLLEQKHAMMEKQMNGAVKTHVQV